MPSSSSGDGCPTTAGGSERREVSEKVTATGKTLDAAMASSSCADGPGGLSEVPSWVDKLKALRTTLDAAMASSSCANGSGALSERWWGDLLDVVGPKSKTFVSMLMKRGRTGLDAAAAAVGGDPNSNRHGALHLAARKMLLVLDEEICDPIAMMRRFGATPLHFYAKGRLCRSIWQIAICSGLLWLGMKMSLGDISLLLVNNCSLMGTVKLSNVLDNSFAIHLGATILPISQRQMVRLVDIIEDMSVSNKVTVCLDASIDGTEHNSLKSVQGGIGAIRAWCLKYGLHFDVSSIYGPNLILYTTPSGGTFYITIEYKERSITLLLAGRDLYVKGWKGALHGSFELYSEGTPYMLGDVRTISLGDNCRFLARRTVVGETWMGPDALRDSFETLYKCEGERSKGVGRAVGIFAVHFAEAARIQRVYKTECRSFQDYDQTTLDPTDENSISVDPPQDSNSFWIQNYGYYCAEAMRDTQARLANRVPPGIRNRRLGNVKSSVEVFKEIRVVLRDACAEAEKEKMPPLVEDPNDDHNKMALAAETKQLRLKQKRGRHIEKPLIHEFSVGDGDFPPYGYLLEDWYPEADKENEEIEEEGTDKEIKEEEIMTQDEEKGTTEEGTDKEIKEQEMKTEDEEEGTTEDEDKQMDEKIKQEAGEDKSYGDFLSHFPTVRKFIEKKKNHMQSMEKVNSAMDAAVTSVRRMQMAKTEDISSVTSKMRSKVLPKGPPLPKGQRGHFSNLVLLEQSALSVDLLVLPCESVHMHSQHKSFCRQTI